MVVAAPPPVVGVSTAEPEVAGAFAVEVRLGRTEEGVDLAGRSGSLSFFFPNSAEKTTPTSSDVSRKAACPGTRDADRLSHALV